MIDDVAEDPVDPVELAAGLLAHDDDRPAVAPVLVDDVLTSHDDQTLRQVLSTGGWSMATVLFGLNLVDEFDRVTLQVLAPDIQRTFGISDAVLSLLNGVGAVFILFGAIPFGVLADRTNRTRLVAFSSLVWSIAAIVGGFTRQAWQLALTRVLNGLGKGNEPVHTSLLADQYPIAGRGRVFALHALANPIGLLLGPALAGGIATVAGGTEGWRWSLVLLSIPALALTLASFLLREPDRGRHEVDAVLGVDGAALIGDGSRISLSAGFERLKKIRTYFYLMASLGVLGLAVFGAPTVFNLLLERRYDLDALGRGFVSSGIAVGGAIGTLVGGRKADEWYRVDPPRILHLVGGSFALFGVLYPIGLFMPNVIALTVIHAVASAFVLAPLVAMTTVMAAVVPFRLRGLSFAMVGLYLFLVGGLIGGFFIGLVSDALGERAALLLFVTPACIVSGGVIAFAARFVRGDISLVVEEIQEERDERARVERSTEDAPLLQVHNLDFSYGQVQVLFDVNVEVRRGEVLALLGTNGAGKSTLLRVISGLALPERGVIRFEGRTITYASPEERVRAGIVQVPGGRAVFPTLSVRENLVAGAYTFVWEPERVEARIDEVCARFPALLERLDQPAGTMSGGEQQMLALAKAMLLDPTVLIIDELSLGLAPVVVNQLLGVVEQLKTDGVTVVLVEQSVNVALTIADRAVFMEKGEIRFEGEARDLLERDDLVRAVFLGAEGG